MLEVWYKKRKIINYYKNLNKSSLALWTLLAFLWITLLTACFEMVLDNCLPCSGCVLLSARG